MYDATHANVPALHAQQPHAAIVAWYGTGSLDIIWTGADRALFPGAELVGIDQGGPGSPVYDLQVVDVEPGAWRPDQLAARMAKSTAKRPTVYCDRNDLPAVREVWAGDVWLAWPGWTGEPLPGPGIVAVQDVWGTDYDRSTVLDPYWPALAPVPGWQEDMMRALPTVGLGATGPDVQTVQGLLCARGHMLTIDGVFGPVTEGDVRAVQSSAGVAVDGVVGPQTWPVLMGVN